MTACPFHGDYVVANTKQGGAQASVMAEMTVGYDDVKYKAKRSKTETITWSPLKVDYFNLTADEAYRNSGNYTDEETGLIGGAKDENAGTESLIATGDIIRLTCNTTADVDYKYRGWLAQAGATITGKDCIYDEENLPDDKNYTSGNSENTVISLRALRATKVGEAIVTFTDRITGFKVSQDDKFCTLYTPFSFEIPSYNLDTNSEIVRDDSYDTTDLVVTGSKSLTTTNDKKLYVDKLYDANDNGVVTPEFVYANYSKANSITAPETAAAKTANDAVNKYTLACQTQYDNKNVSTNRQGRSHLSAVYPDFGSRYTKEKIVYVWYPLKVEFERPLNKDAEKTEAYTGEPLVLVSSQYDHTNISINGKDVKTSKPVCNQIKKADCNFYKDFNRLSYDGIDITNTFSSDSVAYTSRVTDTTTYTVVRGRTNEEVSGSTKFRPTIPSSAWNKTSAEDSTSKSTTVAEVNDDTNRMACGDYVYYKDEFGNVMDAKDLAFELYKGSSERKVLQDAASRNASARVATYNGDGEVATNSPISFADSGTGTNTNALAISKQTDTNYYALTFDSKLFKFEFADKTLFAEQGASYGPSVVYRFDNGIDTPASGFKSYTKQGITTYWTHEKKAIKLHSIYYATYNNVNKGSKNVIMNSENGKEVAAEGQDSDYKVNADDIKLEIKSGSGSIAGVDSGIYINHSQFYGRAKNFTFKTFTNLSKDIHLVEMHGVKLDLGTGASDNLTASSSDLEKVELSGSKLWIVTKKLNAAETEQGSAEKICTLKNNVNGEKYTIKVNVHDFVANVYNVFNDNFGYKWTNKNGVPFGDSKNKNVLVPSNNALIGDTLAVIANSGKFGVSWEVQTGVKQDNVTITSKGDTLYAKNFTTRTNEASSDVKGFLYDNDFFNYDLYDKEGCAIKYFSTATKDGKMPSVLKTSFWEPYLSVKKHLVVKDKEISNYYPDNIENGCMLDYTFASQPGVWFITKEYDRYDTGTGDNNLPVGVNTHIGSYAFTNAKNGHGITYSAKGVNYVQEAEGIIGSCKSSGGITYLNVSELNTNRTGAKNILDWTSNPGRYKTYETIKHDAPQLDSGFVSKTNNGQISGETGDYVYMLPTGWWFNGSKHVFTVSYNIHKTNRSDSGWKIVGRDPSNSNPLKKYNQVFDFDVAMDNPALYKKCLFVTDKYDKNSNNEGVSSETSKINMDYPSVGAGTCEVAKFSGKEISNSYICTDTYKNLTRQTNRSIFNEKEEIGDMRCIRINARKLGWLEEGVDYVDINITFISTKELNRSFTIPIRFYNKETYVANE